MRVLIVGSGKLARELLETLRTGPGMEVQAWGKESAERPGFIAVHAGSGRELPQVVRRCRATHSPLLELATGSDVKGSAAGIPVVVCPNTNILMLKFLYMLHRSGSLFKGYRVEVTESHQAQKRSVPGTAVDLARALGVAPDNVRSIRDPGLQRAMGIPEAYLTRHAYHQVKVFDANCALTLETQVCADAPYADGLARILQAVDDHPLENRVYQLTEFFDMGWL